MSLVDYQLQLLSKLGAGYSYNQLREEMERYQAQLRTPEQMRQLSKNAYELSAKEYERYVMGTFDPVAVPSSAPYTPITDAIEASDTKDQKIRRKLRIGSGEELISIAVRKDDGTIYTRSA